jgi:hypothetical protein
MKLIGKKIETPDRDYFSFVFLVLTVSLLEKTRVIKDLTGDIERRRQKSTLIGIEETVGKKRGERIQSAFTQLCAVFAFDLRQ